MGKTTKAKISIKLKTLENTKNTKNPQNTKSAAPEIGLISDLFTAQRDDVPILNSTDPVVVFDLTKNTNNIRVSVTGIASIVVEEELTKAYQHRLHILLIY